MKELKVVMMMGIPGSGKTTKAKKLAAQDSNKWVRICRDDLREMSGTYWVPDREDYIHRAVYALIEVAVSEEKNIILDEMNINPETKLRYIFHLQEMARKYDCTFHLIVDIVDTPLEVCLERNSTREGDRKVPEVVIRKQSLLLRKQLDTGLLQTTEFKIDRTTFRVYDEENRSN